MGGKEEEGKEMAVLPRGSTYAGSFVLRLVSLSCRQGISGYISGDSFSRIFISFAGVRV